MENASKALLMAASVLIALVIIGALILMFNNLTNYQSTKTVSNREAQVIEFNNQYETYNRKNVRGSELLSLLNRAADYNRRTSSASDGSKGDEGQDLLYEPITISFTINQSDITSFIYNDRAYLLTQNTWKVSGREDTFGKDMKSKIDDLEGNYTADSLAKMVKEISNILIEVNPRTTQAEKDAAMDVYNKCSINKTKINNFGDLKSKSFGNCTIEEAIRTYYEYVQFKRARFDCIEGSVKYNDGTGRITKMEFEFNGKFE